ncbi:hypothetical protein HaLaN_02678 [Haematococcus lacustris]|uniref:Uncharacterized protein n=1 Tax=Haematococcus lacustris TaxID=44745 RepID=A0A699YIU3_HAELA|nr:hypothetical protein HaLaN_02678 [Haematococcus lacustris]
MDSRQLASSLYSLACLGYLDSSVRSLAAKAVSSGHSQLASEPQLNSMAAALQLVQALAAAGYNEVEQGAVSLDGTVCSQLVVKGPGLTRGIAVYQSHEFLPDGSMSGAVAHVKLQQLAHFDAGVVVNKAVFDQLASDNERAAFMREQGLHYLSFYIP